MTNIFKKMLGKRTDYIYPFVIPATDLRTRLPMKIISKMKVLNVGIGSGQSGLARQLPYIPFRQLDNIEIHKPYIDEAKTIEYDAKEVNFYLADIRDIEIFDYDLVLMFDILEHLKKEESLEILKRIKCSQLIFIPLEKEFRPNIYEAKSQDHLSLWTEGDFISRGYKTERLKYFHNEGGRIFDALWASK